MMEEPGRVFSFPVGKNSSGDGILSVGEIESFATNYPVKFETLQRACNLLTMGTDVDGPFTMSSLDYVLLPLKLRECNAASNASFSDAYCSIEQYKDVCIRFSGLFKKGCNDLVDYLRESKIPQDPNRQIALRKLVTFFANDLNAVVESDEVKFKSEAHVCLFLMNHLISKLSANGEWKMDYGTRAKPALVCPCFTTDCPVKGAVDEVFADLSIGNSQVWHGTVDAMTFSRSGTVPIRVPCVVLDEGGAGDTIDGEEVADYHSFLDIDFEEENVKGNRSHLFAETVVNSFLHKSLDSSVSFVPVLGIKHNAIQVIMYDAELDILLATVELQFKNPSTCTMKEEMSYVTYLLIWLTCNFEIFSSTLDQKEMLELKTKCANFANLAKEKLIMYKNGLRFQKVRCKASEKELQVPKNGAMYGFDPQLQIKRARLN